MCGVKSAVQRRRCPALPVLASNQKADKPLALPGAAGRRREEDRLFSLGAAKEKRQRRHGAGLTAVEVTTKKASGVEPEAWEDQCKFFKLTVQSHFLMSPIVIANTVL